MPICVTLKLVFSQQIQHYWDLEQRLDMILLCVYVSLSRLCECFFSLLTSLCSFENCQGTL